MLIFISLFTHQGNQGWDEGDEKNTFFLFLSHVKEARAAQVWEIQVRGKRQKVQNLVESCPHILGTQLFPKSWNKGFPLRKGGWVCGLVT